MKASKLSPATTRALALIIVVFAACGRARPPEDAYRQNNRGVAHLERQEYAAAVTAFRRALEIAPALTMARLNLAIALYYNGDLAAAAREARAAADRMGNMPQPSYVMGLIARAENRDADAIRAFERVVQLDPDDSGSRVQLGQLYLAQRQYQQAVNMFEAALAREPFNATAAYGVAMAFVRDGQRETGAAAMARFEALRENPAAITHSMAYLEQGRYGEAIASTGLEEELVDKDDPGVRFTDATTTVLTGGSLGGRVSLADLDGDGDLDAMLVGADGVRWLVNDAGRLVPRAELAVRASGLTAGVAADLDNDTRIDLLVLGDQGVGLYRQEGDGTFQEVALPAAGTNRADPLRTACFVDFDHDGDLDIFVAPPNRLLRNNGNRTFTDVTAAARVSGGRTAIAVAPTDYDNHRDIDLLVVSRAERPALFANQRDGTFRDVAPEARLPASASYSVVAAGDINKDGAPDLFFGRRDAAGLLAASDGRGRFAVTTLPRETSGATAAGFLDYDNDGLLDLLVLTAAGPRLLRNVGSTWVDVTARALPAPPAPAGDRADALAIGDVDNDGDADLIVGFESGQLRAWRNEGGAARSSLKVRLVPRVSNRSALGAKIDIRAGSLRHRFETSAATPPVAPADVLAGLAARDRADVVRILWPAGILQTETDPPRSAMTVQEVDRKPSSCPFLFTWNGSRFEFVTDFLGGGEMGYWVAPGVRGVPDPDEYVRIREDQLHPRDGRYELRVTNELEEALFVDRIQLLAVEHPTGVEVYPNEGLRSPAERRPFSLYTAQESRVPRRAVDDAGRDVLERVSAIDRRYAEGFRLDAIQGYAAEHTLTLDLGSFPRGAQVRLLLTGWTDYAFSSDNVAGHQAGLAFRPPLLQMKTPGGRWRTVMPELGLPVGRPQTVVADLTAYLPRLGTAVEVRIVTTLRVYWDRILVDASVPAPYSIVRLEPVEAQLRSRGFSAELSPDGRLPFVFDYDRVSPRSPWKTMPGKYTREGDVRPLLLGADDRFVVSAPGDEIALSFDARALPPLGAGRARTFLLYADGFSKEMNLHSASPDRLDPLPFHAMTNYPYAPPEHYPRTPAHERYRAEYNTRVIGGPLPPLDSESRQER